MATGSYAAEALIKPALIELFVALLIITWEELV